MKELSNDMTIMDESFFFKKQKLKKLCFLHVESCIIQLDFTRLIWGL